MELRETNGDLQILPSTVTNPYKYYERYFICLLLDGGKVFFSSHISLKKQAFHFLYCLNLMEDTQMTFFLFFFFLLFACEGLL